MAISYGWANNDFTSHVTSETTNKITHTHTQSNHEKNTGFGGKFRESQEHHACHFWIFGAVQNGIVANDVWLKLCIWKLVKKLQGFLPLTTILNPRMTLRCILFLLCFGKLHPPWKFNMETPFCWKLLCSLGSMLIFGSVLAKPYTSSCIY